MRISKNKLLQYITIYIMLILNQSNLFRYFLMPFRIGILFLLGIVFLLLCSKKRVSSELYLLFLLASVVIVRIISGGTGLETYADYAIPIMITAIAVSVNPEQFIGRYISTVVFLSGISLIGVLLVLVSPGLIRAFPISFVTGWGNSVWTSATDYTTSFFKGYGVFLFSWIDRMGSGIRNVGIFTEPGIFQMVINSALFCLLFMREYYDINEKKVRSYLLILAITMLTCQSTSGLLGMAAIFICAIILSKELSDKVKKRVLGLVFLAIVAFGVDSIVRGENSILQSVIINKLVADDGAFSLASSSSGMARIGTITVCLMLMVTHPLGLGTVETSQRVLQASSSNVAGALMSFGATMGVIPFIGTLVWLLRPVTKWRKSTIVKVLFLFLYLNTALAQSSAFYPALILVPVFLREAWKRNLRGEYYESC